MSSNYARCESYGAIFSLSIVDAIKFDELLRVLNITPIGGKCISELLSDSEDIRVAVIYSRNKEEIQVVADRQRGLIFVDGDSYNK